MATVDAMKYTNRPTLVAIGLLLGWCVSARSAAGDEGDRWSQDGAARASLQAAQGRLAEVAAEKGMAEALSEALSVSAVYLHPGAPAQTGRATIRRFLADLASTEVQGPQQLHTLATGISTDRLLGFALGWTEGIGESEPSFGRFIAVWRRGVARWRVEAYLRRDSNGPPGPVPNDARLVEGFEAASKWRLPEDSATQVAAADFAFNELSIDEGTQVAFEQNANAAAVLITGEQILWNRETIGDEFGSSSATQTLRWAPIRSESTFSGDLGWSVGYASFIVDEGTGEPLRFPSKYLTVWARSSDDTWRYLVDGGNPGR